MSSGTTTLDTATSGQQPAPKTTKKKRPHVYPVPSVIVPKDPEKAIKGAVEAVLAPHPPGRASVFTACGFYVTDGYLQTTYGGRQGCVRALVPGSAADEVKVSAVVVRGDRATARAVPTGGPSSGETITVHLVRYRSYWKVDLLRSNAPVGP